MIRLTIDNTPVEVNEGTTILDAAKSVGIEIPTLCYLAEVSSIAACRVCVVEIEGAERLATSCNTVAQEGMVVHTASERVIEARRVVVDLIRSQHEMNCGVCVRNQTCKLQKLGRELGVLQSRYRKELKQKNWDETFPLIRQESKCIKCMRCIQMCNKVQTVGIWDYINSGGRTTVGVSGGRRIAESNCTVCGQCITVCPVGALYERDDTAGVIEALDRPETTTVAQINGSVAKAWAESVRLPEGKDPVRCMTQALRQAGFDHVFDTDVSIAVAMRESAREIREIIESDDPNRFPLLNSGCPSWVRYVKSNYPVMTRCLSRCKSAQQMFGVLVKTDFARSIGVQPESMYCVNITPCLSAKTECELDTMQENGVRDIDAAITTREIIRLIRARRINPFNLEGEECDNFEDFDNIGGMFFKKFGGSMEGSLRAVYGMLTDEEAPADIFRVVKQTDELLELEVDLLGKTYNCVVAMGLGAAGRILQDIRSGRKMYHFVEALACSEGCENGGGQPLVEDGARHVSLAETGFQLTDSEVIRFSEGRVGLEELFDRVDGLEERLDTDHTAWKMPVSPSVARDLLIPEDDEIVE